MVFGLFTLATFLLGKYAHYQSTADVFCAAKIDVKIMVMLIQYPYRDESFIEGS